jgi:zinc protease
MLNRKIGPVSKQIKKLLIPDIEMYKLSNGVNVCEVNLGSQEILKIDIVHIAGRSVEDFPLSGRAVSSLIKDGCRDKSSAQIAEEIDYYGSSIKTGSNMDFSYTTLYTLTRHIDRVLPILFDMYYFPTFPEDEIEKFKHLNIQKLKEELNKNDVLSYRRITEEIFGRNHSYGYNSTENDYLNITKNHILSHYNDYVGTDNCYLFLSGKINDQVRKTMADLFGTSIKNTRKKEYSPSITPVAGSKINLISKNEHQSSIKTGRKLFDKNHPDNVVFYLLNTILGGYFGSRLMTSIREDKGYTYDISTTIDQMLYDGCFYVSTEAAPEYVEPILKEIYLQMDLLKNEYVGAKELNMVKNYLMGTFMNLMDGPMNVSSFAKSMILSGKKPLDFLDFTDEMVDMSSENILKTAQIYLNMEDMTEVIVSPY